MDLHLCYSASEDTFPYRGTSKNAMARLGFRSVVTPIVRI